MCAQKRSRSENLHDEEEESLQQPYRRKQSRRKRQAQEREEELHDNGERVADEGDDEDEDSDGGVSEPEDLPEYISVKPMDVRKDVECPICLGIIKETRTVMECLHRFCRECIDKAMRLGNNECPSCRTHCASRRSLRADPRYDAMIACLFPDTEKYEEQELAFHEEEKTRNKQIQESIAQIFRRQSEALTRRRTMGKDTAAESSARLPRNCRNAYSRRRRNNRSTEIQGSDDNEDENDQDANKDSSPTDEHETEIKSRKYKRRTGARCTRGSDDNEDENDQDANKDSSPTDEHETEIKLSKYKRRTGARCTRPSPSAVANSGGGCVENEIEESKESRGGTPPGIVWSTKGLTWGGGGARSHTRHGSASGSKGTRSSRLSKLVDHLQSLKENDDDELEVHLRLISLDKQRTPNLQLPHLCCNSNLSVEHLCHYVAQKTQLQAEEVEMLLVKDTPNTNGEQSTINNTSTSMDYLNSLSQVVVGCKRRLQTLQGRETLAGLKDNCIASSDHLILAYRQKGTK